MSTVDKKTTLAGSNHFEVLLFTLRNAAQGLVETYGINVFKVREVVKLESTSIARIPGAAEGVRGMVSLRGQIIPVVDMTAYLNPGAPALESDLLLVTEYGGHTQAFIVASVDRIVAVNWSDVKAYSDVMGGRGDSFVTGVLKLGEDRLVSILDVERILSLYSKLERQPDEVTALAGASRHTVLFADDSVVARSQILSVLNRLGVKPIACENGAQALAQLEAIKRKRESKGGEMTDYISVLLTDIEMPEMDGYVLTHQIRADRALAGLPVVMYSSLSSPANKSLGLATGADRYVEKFATESLVEALRPYLT